MSGVYVLVATHPQTFQQHVVGAHHSKDIIDDLLTEHAKDNAIKYSYTREEYGNAYGRLISVVLLKE